MITSNSFATSVKEVTIVSDYDLKPSDINSLGNVLDLLSQQDKVNIHSNTNYSTSSNAVKLLSPITNNNGKIKLYTEVNSNIKVGDRVFLMYNAQAGNDGSDGIIMDNYLEFSGCTNYLYLEQMQGYNVIEINESNNEITIDRYFDIRFQNKKIYNHYISQIYIRNIEISGGEIDGATILNGNFNTVSDSELDINLVQSIIFSGTSYFIRYKDKYDGFYISTNSVVNTGVTTSIYKPYTYKGVNSQNQDPTPVSSYYGLNNQYGYIYVMNQYLESCRIDNGYYENCTFNQCILNGGQFNNCNVTDSTINYGTFNNTILDSSCYWFNGIWNGGEFSLDVWYDGIWKSGNFCNKQWRNGTFQGGYFSGSTWKNGTFEGGVFENSPWSGGTFTGGIIRFSEWLNGTFNGGDMSSCNWYYGVCNGGFMLNVNWFNGTFNNGEFNTGFWYNGEFNDGSMLNSYWGNGTFNKGIFNSGNNVTSISSGVLNMDLYVSGRSWHNGIFNGGVFSNSIWSGGTFKGGNFQDNSLWLNGIFKDGNFINSNWVDGNFLNGTVTKSYFHKVNWENGIWNSGNLGIYLEQTYNGVTIQAYPQINWSGGTFNNGTFGMKGNDYIYWWKGDFYGGDFYNLYTPTTEDTPCQNITSYGGFYGGTFHNGNFMGVFYGGMWINGVFNGRACSGNIMDRVNKNNVVFKKSPGFRKYGEQNLISPQQGIRNTN